MSLSQTSKHWIQRASVVTGALLCLGLGTVSSSCGEDGSTPDWGANRTHGDAAAEAPAHNESPQHVGARDAELPVGQGLRFMAYNVENWLSMERRGKGSRPKTTSKPEAEKQAVVSLVRKHRPDVLGIAEIGTEADLADLQKRLKKAGLAMPFSHFAGGSDPVRHQGLLSRFPITSTAMPKVTEYRLQGRTYGINRGILDATVERGARAYRFLGVHLKSKREVAYVDQEQMRIHEAHLLRRHVESILKAERKARLVVYGDFNDTRKSIAMKTVAGDYGAWDYLTAIPMRDSRGHAWTHYWDYQDVYARIDFVAVTQALKREVDFRASFIVDDAVWENASDHRPLLAIFR